MPIQLLIIALVVFLALANLTYYVWWKPDKGMQKYLAPYKRLPEWVPFRNVFISWVSSHSSATIWSLRIFSMVAFLALMTLIVYLAIHP